MKNPALERVLILLLSAATFLSLLGRKDIVTSHEARVAQTGRIMATAGWGWNAMPVTVPVMRMVETDGMKDLVADPERGQMQVNPWLVPVINNQVRLQKPPLPYWCDAVVFRLAGFGEWQARIVTALLGAMATWFMWDLGRMILGRRAAFIAAGVWLSTHFIVDEYRKSMADPYLAFFILMCVWAWVRALRSSSPLNGRWVIVFYVSMTLAALAKGPLIFIVLIALIALRRRPPGPWWAHLVGLTVFIALVLPWPLYIIRHVPNAMDIWRYESVGEMTGENTEKARPWWMYIGNSFQLPLPWTPLWMGGFAIASVRRWRGIRSPRGKRRSFAILWQVATVTFFSFASVKKPAYLLPVMPAQTLIVTDAILVLLAFARRRASRAGHLALSTIAPLAQALIGLGFAMGLTFWMFRGTVDRGVAVACGALMIITSLASLAPILRGRFSRWPAAQFVAYAVIVVVLLGVDAPAEENLRSSRSFAAELVQYQKTSQLPIVMPALPEDLAVYLPLNLPDATGSSYALLAVDHSKKDPPETLDLLSKLVGNGQVIDARRIDTHGADGNGRWRLFEITISRTGIRT